MCTIYGFCWDDPSTLVWMEVETSRRGPDGHGTYTDPGFVSLGQNLLALNDTPDNSKQPWADKDGVLCFNGEVYNADALRRELPGEFRTTCDTEVLARGLATQGVDFLKKVDGMFAVAYYQPALKRLTLARDTNGSKPLYYACLGDGRPAFASEIRALRELGFGRHISKDGFRHYYHAGLVAGPLTLFDGIYRILPGQVIIYNIQTRTATDTNLQEPPKPFTGRLVDAPAMLAEALAESVRRTLTGVRRRGLLLSGGMDSGAVYRETVDALFVPPRTFSTRFSLPHERCLHNGDADVAALLAGQHGSKHREVLVDEQTWVDNLLPAVTALEEPRQGKSLPAYFHTYHRVREFDVITLLTGDGGDELLMGYKHQGARPFADRLVELRRDLRPLPDPTLALSTVEQAEYLRSWLPAAGLTGDAANDFLYAERLHTLAEDFLVRSDKMGGWFGMETRFPMLCKPFRDLAAAIPSAWKVGTEGASWAVNNKHLLRQAYANRLPQQVTGKAKTGWRAPTDDWLIGIASHPAKEGPLRDYVRETLADPLIRELLGITDDLVENHYLNNRDFGGPPKQSGKPSLGPGLAAQKELFTVLMFTTWVKAFNMLPWW